MLKFHPLPRVDAGLNRRHAEEITSLLTPSQDCLCKKPIVEHVTGLSFVTYFRCTDGSCRGCACHTSLLWSHTRSLQDTTHIVLTGIHRASFGRLFDVLTGGDVVGDVHAGLQCPVSQRHGSSLEERQSTAKQTPEQTTQPVPRCTLAPTKKGSAPVGCNNLCNHSSKPILRRPM